MKYCRVLLVHCLVKASTAWEHKPNISTNGEDKRSSLRNSKHFDRDLWQFEQDDMFMQLTTAGKKWLVFICQKCSCEIVIITFTLST
jgi:hypothetical protein